MYSMAREHMPSKLELAKVGAAATLVGYIDHEVKQCRLNATAALYAVSCGGRAICKDISALKPLGKLRSLVNPGVGRSAQDDQLQLFATLLVVNLLHVKGTTGERLERQELLLELQRAYDDATEQQGRDTITLGIKRLQKMDSKKERFKAGAISGAGKVVRAASFGRCL